MHSELEEGGFYPFYPVDSNCLQAWAGSGFYYSSTTKLRPLTQPPSQTCAPHITIKDTLLLCGQKTLGPSWM